MTEAHVSPLALRQALALTKGWRVKCPQLRYLFTVEMWPLQNVFDIKIYSLLPLTRLITFTSFIFRGPSRASRQLIVN